MNFNTPPNGQAAAHTNGDHDHYHSHDPALVHDHCTCSHTDGDSGDDEIEFDHPDYRYVSPAAGQNGQAGRDTLQRRLMDAAHFSSEGKPLDSTASSADGYESFENTSNKKKRKIPLASASSSIHQSRLSAELANMGISYSARPVVEGDVGEYATNGIQGPPNDSSAQSSYRSAGTGISGAGRGRYGRREVKDGRRPLASTAVNSAGGHVVQQAAHTGLKGTNGEQLRKPMQYSADRHQDVHPGQANAHTSGIISRAIRSAAESAPLTPQKENVSLLQQNSNRLSASPKTQFTFTCESDSGNKMHEQAPADVYRDRSAAGYPVQNNKQRGSAMNGANIHQSTQTANMSNVGAVDNSKHYPHGLPPIMNPQPPQMPPSQQAQQAQQQPNNQKLPRPRRSQSKELAFAARQRKLQQQYSNYHHKPRREDMWICQFCEYEDIFGEPPMALIRSYEIKDRQERKKAAEKRRLLEKAKQRGRKGKKGSGKNGNKGQGVAPPAPVQDPGYDGAPLDGDDYFDDEDGYDYDPVGPDGEDDYDDGGYYPPPPPVPLTSPPDLGMPHGLNSARNASAAG